MIPPGRARQRIPELDGLRGIAMLLVLLWHWVALRVPPDTDWGGMIRKGLMLSWTGVDLFFVLSGFLIGGIVLDQRRSENLFQVFYARRACRILPAYFVVLTAYLIALACRLPERSLALHHRLFAEPLPLWTYVTFLPNFAMAWTGSWGAGWLSVTWSLAVEEQFYMLVPVLLVMLPRRAHGVMLGACVVAAPVLRMMLADAPPAPGFASFVLMPCRMDALMSGVLGAWMLRQDRVRHWLSVNLALLYAILAALVVGMVAFHRGLTGVFAPSLISVGYTWMAMGYLCVILIAIHDRAGAVSWISRRRWLRALGRISYTVYLTHQIISAVVASLWHPEEPFVRTWADGMTVVLTAALTIGLASVSWRFLEQPMIELGHRLNYRPVRSNQYVQQAA